MQEPTPYEPPGGMLRKDGPVVGGPVRDGPILHIVMVWLLDGKYSTLRRVLTPDEAQRLLRDLHRGMLDGAPVELGEGVIVNGKHLSMVSVQHYPGS